MVHRKSSQVMVGGASGHLGQRVMHSADRVLNDVVESALNQSREDVNARVI